MKAEETVNVKLHNDFGIFYSCLIFLLWWHQELNGTSWSLQGWNKCIPKYKFVSFLDLVADLWIISKLILEMTSKISWRWYEFINTTIDSLVIFQILIFI
jgi:hypothetical protein